ncbi:hypothetical protein Patl1_25217 [Pistacia atlantica]|uniref:Uncharacterized protein n=1 Tax=Pistacia atlantica TaxID=434234 RepID=A0ACC1B228_9ROSI|nr:hypothetical protein Patl1_25217 [Pistacia atlantica]
MLPSIDLVKAALVVDPVMDIYKWRCAGWALPLSLGFGMLKFPLISDKEDLLPMADIVTPNVKEASALLGMRVATVADMRSAAKLLHNLGPRNVLVKGGDLHDSSDAIDIFLMVKLSSCF